MGSQGLALSNVPHHEVSSVLWWWILYFQCRTHSPPNECSARWKNKMYYSVWVVFSLSYENRRLMFYSSNIANFFLNKRFAVSYSGSTSSRTPLESLQAKTCWLIFMVLISPIHKTGTIIFSASESKGYNDCPYYWYEQWVFVDLWKNINWPALNANGIDALLYWSWTTLPSLLQYNS